MSGMWCVTNGKTWVAHGPWDGAYITNRNPLYAARLSLHLAEKIARNWGAEWYATEEPKQRAGEE